MPWFSYFLRRALWWLLLSCLAGTGLLASNVCKRLDPSVWLGPVDGFTLVQSEAAYYVYATKQEGSTTVILRLQKVWMVTDWGEPTIDWLSSGQSYPGTLFPADFCMDSAADAAGPTYSFWEVVGWGILGGLIDNGPPEGSEYFQGQTLIWEHGIQALGTGNSCGDCNSGSGGGGGGVNTNQFHLDVTNSLAGISNVLSETHRYQRGDFTESERSGMIGSVTNDWASIIEQGRGWANEALGSATNVARMGEFVPPPPEPDDFFIGGFGVFAFLEAAASAFAGIIRIFRLFAGLAMAWYLARQVREDLYDAFVNANMVAPIPSAGSDIPFLDLVIGKARGFFVVSALFGLLPLALSVMVDTVHTYWGFEDDVQLQAALGDPAGYTSTLFSAIPKIGRAFAFLDLFVPLQTAIACAAVYTVFCAEKVKIFYFAVVYTKMI